MLHEQPPGSSCSAVSSIGKGWLAALGSTIGHLHCRSKAALGHVAAVCPRFCRLHGSHVCLGHRTAIIFEEGRVQQLVCRGSGSRRRALLACEGGSGVCPAAAAAGGSWQRWQRRAAAACLPAASPAPAPAAAGSGSAQLKPFSWRACNPTTFRVQGWDCSGCSFAEAHSHAAEELTSALAEWIVQEPGCTLERTWKLHTFRPAKEPWTPLPPISTRLWPLLPPLHTSFFQAPMSTSAGGGGPGPGPAGSMRSLQMPVKTPQIVGAVAAGGEKAERRRGRGPSRGGAGGGRRSQPQVLAAAAGSSLS